MNDWGTKKVLRFLCGQGKMSSEFNLNGNEEPSSGLLPDRRVQFRRNEGMNELALYVDAGRCEHQKCAFCALPSMSKSISITSAENVGSHINPLLESAKRYAVPFEKVTYFCCGSMLNPNEISISALEKLIDLSMESFPSISVVSLESRAEHIKPDILERLLARVGSQRKLEIAIGYETKDALIRNTYLMKNFKEKMLDAAFRTLAQTGCLVKVYVMLKPAYLKGWSSLDWVREAAATIRHVATIGKQRSLNVRVHLNPTYVTSGSPLEFLYRAGKYKIVKFHDVLKVLIVAEKSNIPIQIGLDDEGLAIEKGSFLTTGGCPPWGRQLLLDFNDKQDFTPIKMALKIIKANRLL